ncbi:MAG: hypothetical protein R2854_27495 [Caldilineaceae bacterium]
MPRESRLDKALLACDELTGLILACAYVRPDRDLRSVKLKSVKKWKDKAFTAAIDRQENMEFIVFVFGRPRRTRARSTPCKAWKMSWWTVREGGGVLACAGSGRIAHGPDMNPHHPKSLPP